MLREAIQSINETKITIYHGDNHNTTKLELKNMMLDNANNQEGIGIYFGSLNVAKDYGKYIVKAEVEKNNFWESRKDIGKYAKSENIFKMLKELVKFDSENMFYLITDYGYEMSEPNEINVEALLFLAKKLRNEQVRNFQILLAENFGVENFVKIWNKIFPKNLGTFNKELDIYAIINPKVKIQKYNEV